MMAALDSALSHLRELLLQIKKPTGSDGFEGLIADALAAATGLVFRLAKSGAQFGRDACSTPAPFAIAMEAKRYTKHLSLEDLAGKATIGGHFLAGKIDLWVLGATSEVGENTVTYLHEIFDKKGISLLVLDWAPRPLPPLATLLALAREVAISWFARHLPGSDHARLVQLLDRIAQSPNFPDQADHLRQTLTASEVGLDALRRQTAQWLRNRFNNRLSSQRAFGQYITIAEASAPAIPRSAALESLNDAMVIDPQALTVVALLGGEGVGKTWLIAQWWANRNDPPILILVAGRRAEVLDPSEPIKSLAQLLAQQQEDGGPEAIASWHRRLRRWQGQGGEGRLRFVVVLDGLNERTGMPWADIIKGLAPLVHALGGLVVVTVREAFWRRDVLPWLSTKDLTVRECPVPEYSDGELTTLLARVGMTPTKLPLRVRDFCRNPRVCAVALNLLRRLSLQPDELTVERLLLEYWQGRMEERGNLVGHTIRDFEKLLRSHASAWLQQPGLLFDRDEWTRHSGAIRRGGGRDLHNDLTEIEEGRFMQIAVGDSGTYEFKKETLPFALALLVIHELKPGRDTTDADVLLDSILDAVRIFDLIAEVVAAAMGLACLDDAFPDRGRHALLRAWQGLQNVDDTALATMSAYLPTRPELFLDAIEHSETPSSLMGHRPSLLGLLIHRRDNPRVRPCLDSRLPQWLGQWSRQAKLISKGEEQSHRQAAHEAKIDAALAALTPEERIIFGKLCHEVPGRAIKGLDYAAALLMAARPLAHLAPGLVAWAFAQAMAVDYHHAGAELAWVIRLNPVDQAPTEAAIHRLLEPITPDSSAPARRAAAIALDLIGTRSASALSDDLFTPSGHSEYWRRVALFCDTNPHDPDAPPGSNLDNARAVAAKTPCPQIWCHMGMTTEDGDLEAIIPALARFDPSEIVKLLREIVRSITDRSQLSFRQLACSLPGLSPLFDQATIRSLKEAFDRLLAQPTMVSDNSFGLICGKLVRALTPHLTADEQLDLWLRLPPTVPEYLNLRRALKPLSPQTLEQRLATALAIPGTPALRRTLFFASAAPADLTEGACRIIAELTNHPDQIIANLAADIAFRTGNSTVNALVLDQALLRDRQADYPEKAFKRARAVAAALIEQRRVDLLPLVAPRLLGHVASKLGGQAVAALAAAIEQGLYRLLQPIATEAPQDMQLIVAEQNDGLDFSKRVRDSRESSSDGEISARMQELSTPPEVIAQRFAERQAEMHAALHTFTTALANEDAAALISTPPRHGIARIVEHEPERVERWLDQILHTTGQRTLSQVHNLGVVMAGAYALCDAVKAASVLRHLRDHRPDTRVLIGNEHVPLYQYSLFSGVDLPALNSLREEEFVAAFDDAALEEAVAAAEARGALVWLDGYMARLLASSHPGDQARGLTIAGLRHANSGSDEALSVSWGTGFLGDVAAAAAKNYRRDRWARHWFSLVRTATDAIDFWRFGKLAEGVADWRFCAWFNSVEEGDLLPCFGEELFSRLRSAAEKRSKKREDTLFGLKAPDRDLIMMLRDSDESTN